MSSLRALAIDVLAHPGLLTAREQVRNVGRWAKGVQLRTELKLRGDYLPGLLSIVVPVYGVERYLDDCLRSLSVQNYRNIEVIVVDDGSPDNSYAIARRWALRDPRIRIVRQSNAGLSAARNTGTRHARGEFLAFLDSDDFVDRHAYSDAMAILAESGSDFAVMPYRRELKGSFPQAAPWIRNAHAQERMGIVLDDLPSIMVNAVAWSKVYRRKFWDSCEFQFPEGLLYEDQALSMEAFARASRFDVLARVSINWRIREDQSSITQQITTARNIEHHHIAVRDSLDALGRYATESARQERLRQILDNNLGEFLPNIRQMEEPAWTAFVAFISYLVNEVGEPSLWHHVDARKKILVALASSGNRQLALRFLENQGWQPDHFASSPSGTDLIGDFPLKKELSECIDDINFVLSPQETPLKTVARELTQDNAGNFELVLVSYIDRVRPRDVDTMEFELLNAETGSSVPLEWKPATARAAALGHTRRYADMSDALYSVLIPRQALSSDGSYVLTSKARIGDVTRSAVLTTDWKTARSAALEVDDSRVLVPLRCSDRSVIFRVSTPAVTGIGGSVGRETATIRVQSDRPLTHIALVRDGDRFSLDRSVSAFERHEDVWVAQVRLPRSVTSPNGRVTYDLRAFEADGTSHTVYASPQTAGVNNSDSRARYTWARRVRTRTNQTLRGNIQQEFTAGCMTLVDRRDCLSVVGIRHAGDEGVAITCNRISGSAGPAKVTARVGSSTFDVPLMLSEQEIEIRIPLSASVWGRDPRPYPSGNYRLEVEGFEGEQLTLDVHDKLALELPVEFETDSLRATFSRERGALLGIRIEPPLAADEVGGGNRWRMKDWFYTLSVGERKSVLFRNLYGEAANDSALAVHKELQKRESSLEKIWAVKDYSVDVPDDATVVLEESREYYAAFGTANYVMVNVHQPDWFVKRDGQVLIETFHGYPFKLNGYKWWQKLGFTAERQESFFRRAEEWDYLVSPARYATPYLEEFFRPGCDIPTEILEIGYPRNDALLSPDSESIRTITRQRLGIHPWQKAILYAPTFRDYVSADDMSATMLEFVDFSRLSQTLGNEYVILLRGHPFNARQGTSAEGGIINVTDYPDINDLILASDVGVLDYSSLRFDYALSGKPSLYYVPDQQRYFAGRESFVPFEATSPGPKLRSAAELIAALQSSDEIARTYEPQRLSFLGKYMELEDGRAAERLVDVVFGSRGDA